MCRRLFHSALHPNYSLSLRIVWFATNILFILQDSLIHVSRRDEERKMLKEPTLVIVEHARSAWLIKGQCYCPPTVKPKAHPEHRLGSRCVPIPQRTRAVWKPPDCNAPECTPCGTLYPRDVMARCPFSPEASKPAPKLPFLPFCSLYASSGSFNLPFGILFNFPSQYFSSIGLHVIFRFS